MFLVDISINCFYEGRMTIFRPTIGKAELRAEDDQAIAPTKGLMVAIDKANGQGSPVFQFYQAVRVVVPIRVEGVRVQDSKGLFNQRASELPQGSLLLLPYSPESHGEQWFGLTHVQERERRLLRMPFNVNAAFAEPVCSSERLGVQSRVLQLWQGPEKEAHIEDVRMLAWLKLLLPHGRDTPGELELFGIGAD